MRVISTTHNTTARCQYNLSVAMHRMRVCKSTNMELPANEHTHSCSWLTMYFECMKTSPCCARPMYQLSIYAAGNTASISCPVRDDQSHSGLTMCLECMKTSPCSRRAVMCARASSGSRPSCSTAHSRQRQALQEKAVFGRQICKQHSKSSRAAKSMYNHSHNSVYLSRMCHRTPSTTPE
jgi:hypothetical protein